MEDYLNAILEFANRLTALGEKIMDSLFIAVLSSLPESYSTLMIALENRFEDELTLQLVKGKLIDEYKRWKNAKDEVTGNTAMKVGQGNTWKEFFCKKMGHFKKDCLKFKKWKNSKEKASQVQQGADSDSDKDNTTVQHVCSIQVGQ